MRMIMVSFRDLKTYFNPKTERLRKFKERQKKKKDNDEEGEADYEAAPRSLSRDWMQSVWT
jgi:hypothetical protein